MLWHFQNDHAFRMSAKGKMPWITYNGVDVSDTQFCIEYLNKEFSVDLNKDLSHVERSIALAFQKMAEEHLYWYETWDKTPTYQVSIIMMFLLIGGGGRHC